MPVRDILFWPEDCLQKKAEDIINIDFNIVTLAQDMAQTMYTAPGVGLAAPQIGVSKRLIVFDPDAKDGPGAHHVLINPHIIEAEGKEIGEEMCLSVPNVAVEIPRYERILISALNMNGKEVRVEAEGFMARIIQHEMDHLEGKVILGYASSLKRSLYMKKVRKGKI